MHPPRNASTRTFPWRLEIRALDVLQMHHGGPSHGPAGSFRKPTRNRGELAEAVDIQLLPGLQRLWKKHDLNVQGNANHFVNTLWNLFQSRAFHYRCAEIKAGGYLADHVQVPLLVDFPHEDPSPSRPTQAPSRRNTASCRLGGGESGIGAQVPTGPPTSTSQPASISHSRHPRRHV